jgi:hypothetical protein
MAGLKHFAVTATVHLASMTMRRKLQKIKIR